MPHHTPLALLVEADADGAEMYATFLAHVGFRVTLTDSAADAFIQALAERPDVVVTDVRLWGVPDGLALATTLRRDERTSSIPIIVLTGDAFPEHRARAKAAGCDIFLTKPCLPSVLAEQARALLAA